MAKFCGVGVGVGVICLDERGRFLIGRRKGSHGAGTFALPGGHLELNEDWETCARREVLEETGLELVPEKMQYVYTANSCMPNDKHYITIFMSGRIHPGSTPANLEPDKCFGWDFHSWADLRASGMPMFMPLEALLKSSPHAPWDAANASDGTENSGSTTRGYMLAALAGAAAALAVASLARGRR